MKRLILILTLCVMLAFSGIACAAGLQENGFYYYIEGGKAIVSGYGGNATQIVVPETLGGYEVTALDYDCFSGYDHLTSIKLPNTLRKIGWNAFAACRGLTSIEIPSGVTDIGRYAFSGCTNLKSVSLPDSLVNLRRYAFDDCVSLREIVIPANVTEIPGNTFDGCSILSKITIMGMDTTFTDIAAFVMLERFGLCDVFCWKNSWTDNRLNGDEAFPLYYLTAESVPTTTEIAVNTLGFVNPQSVTQENIPAYVPGKPVSKPTLILTSKNNLNGETQNGTLVKLADCYVSREIHLDRDDIVVYDLEIRTESGDPVKVRFNPPEPLILPYPSGMNFREALGMQFTVEHGASTGMEVYSTHDGSLIRTKAGLLLFTSSFSPFTVTWEVNPDTADLPQTGDNSPSVAMLMGLVVLSAAALFVLKRRAA